MVLLAKIAAKSSALRTFSLYDSNLSERGPATAAFLAQSESLHTLNLGDNNLGDHLDPTEKIIIDYNNYLTELPIDTAEFFIEDLVNIVGEYLGNDISYTI